MSYDVLDVCKYIIDYSNKKDYGISNLKLQKMLYFVQAYFLIVTDQQCFKEKIIAWDFGPVVSEAYKKYKQFGSGDIPTTSFIVDVDEDNIWNSRILEYDDDVITRTDKHMIEAVVDKFSDYSATDLVAITHRQAPWKNAYQQGKNTEISPKAIKEYFHA